MLGVALGYRMQKWGLGEAVDVQDDISVSMTGTRNKDQYSKRVRILSSASLTVACGTFPANSARRSFQSRLLT